MISSATRFRGCRLAHELFVFLTDFHRDNGASLIKASASAKREIDGISQPTYFHNHGQSLDPSAHSLYRRRTPAQQAKERELAAERGIRAREITSIIRKTDPDHAFFRKKDIYNDRQAIKRESLDGLTSTQAFVKLLEAAGIKVSTSYDDDGRLEAAF
ncbi:hypothetical protein TOPH_04907 [Tolypocladium ophioglossoides CBS 100239]|uniref:Uncharacterized protein n=1 Tax=Tolypocladium ophioglossoides (strain CBS 100239) TaxID=1163406 RepID=A0A0L0N8I1_TOLOC|nr:hypothetical protein TOPH_04907 [Tolypocladium ophioglossoides CBS 100239]